MIFIIADFNVDSTYIPHREETLFEKVEFNLIKKPNKIYML